MITGGMLKLLHEGSVHRRAKMLQGYNPSLSHEEATRMADHEIRGSRHDIMYLEEMWDREAEYQRRRRNV